MNRKPEILAPAGTMESIIAAINGGADAVYLGGKAFNARQNAGNMTEEEITTAVALCHSHHVKVYVTLNTLIKNSELSALVESLNFLKNLNVDGLIVQDIGVIYLIQKYFPEFKLQTSTQASIYGLEGVLFFENLGFSRVVLPREMPLTEVAEIKKQSNVDLKIFCHGALCYAYSGQCLLSSMIGGRSGNRGLCAQPCRKTYELLDNDGNFYGSGYLLSPKDLNTLDDIKAIVDSGVDSLKIEGRMKTPEYVYGITRAYREKIDQAGGEKVKETMDKQAVMQVFNRDFTRGHLFNEPALLNTQVGKNRGTLIGKVIVMPESGYTGKHREYQHLPIALNEGATLALGDGLSFGEDGNIGAKVDAIFTLDGKRLEKGLGQVAIPCRHGIRPNTLVYKNSDKVLMDRLKKEGSQSVALPDMAVDFKVTIKAGKSAEIKATANGLEAQYHSEFIPEAPLRNSLEASMVAEQLSRLGETDFVLGEIQIDLDPNLFLTRGQLNSLRKEVMKVLEEKLKNNAKKEVVSLTVVPLEMELKNVQENAFEKDEKKRLSVEFTEMPSEEFLLELKDLGVDEIVLPINVQHPLEMAAFAKDQGFAVLLTLPRIMDMDYSKKFRALSDEGIFNGAAIDGLLIGNYEALNICKDQPIYLQADQAFNIFNTLATRALKNWGVSSGVLSPELDGEELKVLSENSALETVLPVYGAQELMLSKKCIFDCQDCLEKKEGSTGLCHRKMTGDLVDERRQSFPVRRDAQGTTHIYNGATLFLREEILALSGIGTWRIYHRNESLETLKTVIGYYSQEIYEKKWGLPQGLGTEGTTRGSFKRGVK
ncbi:MAG: U32 family peptidase [Eubacteriaceae bacterium]|nr:U32 family peptidase [Eubacteriaceae bacterium]